MALMRREAKDGACDPGTRQSRKVISIALIRPAPTIRPKKRLRVNGSKVEARARVLDSVGADWTNSGWEFRVDRGMAAHSGHNRARKYGMRITSASILKSPIWPSGVAASFAFAKREYQYKFASTNVTP